MLFRSDGASAFDIPGATNVENHDGAITFYYKGDVNALMRRIGMMEVSDVTIEEPTLEEIFMHYYE